jgi:hypothetical protein
VDINTFPSDGLLVELLMAADDVYYHNSSGHYYAPDSRPDAPPREPSDPPGPTDGRLFRWEDAAWNGQGDGGVWTAADRFNQIDGAFYFSAANVADGQYGQVRLPNLGIEGSFTMALWVRENDQKGWLVGQEGWAQLSLLSNAGGVQFVIPGSGGVTLTDAAPLQEDTWHFIVATVFYDESIGSSTVRLYRDGQPVDTEVNVGPMLGYLNPDLSKPVLIGDGSGEDDDFNALGAYVDDVRIWDRALTGGNDPARGRGHAAIPDSHPVG